MLKSGTYFKGGTGGTCLSQYLGRGDKIRFVPPKFMVKSRTLSLLFEFAADVFSEIIKWLGQKVVNRRSILR